MKARAGIPETVKQGAEKEKNRFRYLLGRAGMTQVELARRLGVHPNTVSQWAGGKRMPGPAMAYLKLYGQIKDLLVE